MGKEELKVIDFGASRNRVNADSLSVSPELLAELRSIAAQHLGQQMQQLSTVVDDQLFELSGKAENAGIQSDYFRTMRYLRVEFNAVKAHYENGVLRRFDEFWTRRPQRLIMTDVVRTESLTDEDFSLVENAAFEEELAVSTMVEKGSSLHQQDLYALNKRWASLLGREEIPPGENPVGPHVLCNMFAEAVKPLDLDLNLKLLVYKLYDQVVLSGSGDLYREMNTALADAGILTNLGRSAKPSARSARNPAPGPSRPGVHGGRSGDEDRGGDDQQEYAEVFAAMQNLMNSWRCRSGPAADYPVQFDGPAFATAEVLNALSVLQHPAATAAISAADGLKGFVQQRLQDLQPGDATRPIARREEDVIDMVSMIFDFILSDHNLPDPVKVLITRLQIPVVKVAILERSFFGRKNHPVRLLLNALAHAGLGLDLAECQAENVVFKRIEAVVSRILDEFDQDVNLFSELLDEFTALMDKEAQRSQVAEERARQVTQSKEQIHLAKRKIAYEIAMRLQGRAVPSSVKSFLFNTWKDVLILGYLRRSKSDEWQRSLEVMDRLIWSATVALDDETRKQVLSAIPPLLKSVQAGLEALSLEPQTIATAIKELRDCHIKRLARPGVEGKEEASAADGQEQQTVEIWDPDLARAISEIRGNLPDIENFRLQDLVEVPAAVEQGEVAISDECVARARDLAVGEWIDFEESGKHLRAKLSWKSQVTSVYVFVNRRGAKIAEIPMMDLARRFGAGTARIIEGGTVPLMDRALHALLNTLGTSGGSPSPDALQC